MKTAFHIISMLLFIPCMWSQESTSWFNGLTLDSKLERELNKYGEQELFHGKYYRLAKFNNLISLNDRIELNEYGIEVLEYIGNFLYLISVDVELVSLVESPAIISETYEFTKNYKLSKSLLYGDACIQVGKESRIVVKYMKDIAQSQIESELHDLGIIADRIFGGYQLFYTNVNDEQRDQLADLPWVQFMDCESAPGVPEDREGRSLHRVNLISNNYKENLFLKGNTVRVMVRDDGFVGPHIDFEGRITQDVRDDSQVHHADGVAGILAGAGNYDPLVEGMAPGSELYIINYQPDFLDKTLDYHINEGVVITNSSYSNGCNAGYTIEAQVVDKQIYENPELIHVFSAGNSNGLDCGYGAGNQWGNITGGHKIGKNVLTTANLRLNGSLETSSSRGPTRDGRMKPDISARGTNELSTAPGHGTQVFGGTSAASPGVAGVCALLYEAYKNENNMQNPESALIKAAILNTATDIGTAGPDYQYGFGVIDAYKAYKLLEEKRYQKHTINAGENRDFTFTVPAGIPLTKFMLYWAEQEASLLAPKALINDLDMEVIDPSGNNLLPWVLNPTPNQSSLASGAGKGVDTLNNFEQVSINNPSPGEYIVRIKAKFLPSNSIDFFILHEVEDKFLRLSSPIGGEQFSITESTQIYYTAYGQDSIRFLFSSDAGKTWQSFGSEPPNTRLHSVLIPNNISSDSCLIEISQGNLKERSGYFTIANGVQGFQIKKYCPGEVQLAWKKSSKDSFQIYQLGDKYMDPIRITQDTLLSMPNTDPRITKWYSIAGFTQNALSRRELAISTPDTLVGCGITKDLAIQDANSGLYEYFSCGELTIQPKLQIINRTNTPQSGFSVKAFSQNRTVEQYYTLRIEPYDTVIVRFDSSVVIENFGKQQIALWLEYDQDENPFNDTAFIDYDITELEEKNGVYPMLESFAGTSIPSGWIQKNEASDSKWNLVSIEEKNKSNGKGIMYANQNPIYNTSKLLLTTKTADLRGAINPFLYFDLAQHHFTENIYHDSILIKVIQVCDQEHKEKILFSGTSTELSTVDTTSNQNFLPVDSSWYWLAFDLIDFKGKKIIVQFEVTRGIGDRTFLDNVEIREKLPGTEMAEFTIDPSPGCHAKPIRFADTSSISGRNYSWDIGVGGSPRFSLEKGPFVSKYTMFGNKRVILKIKSDVNNDAILMKNLFISPPASVGYNYSIVSGRTVKFNNTSSNALTYLWDFGDGAISTEIHPIHTFDSAKIYRVKLTITNPCGTYMRSINVDLTMTSTEDDFYNEEIIIYPNPVTNEVLVSSERAILELRILNVNGKEVFSKRMHRTNLINVNMQEFATGFYTLEVFTDSKRYIRRIEKI